MQNGCENHRAGIPFKSILSIQGIFASAQTLAYIALRKTRNMKYYIFFFLLLTFSGSLESQNAARIQKGLVREYKSGKKPIAYVQVIFEDAPPSTSDQAGMFRLAFSGKKPGDLIFFQKIVKRGFELVNEKELQILRIGNVENLGKDIIMARAGTIDAAKRKYYEISDQALLASFNEELGVLKKQLDSLQITQELYLDKYNILNSQYLQQKETLDALSDMFAKTDFDDISEECKQALELFEAGRIDESLVILEKADLLSRTERRLKEKKRIAAAEAEISEQSEQNQKEIKDDLQGLQLQAQLYVLTFQVDKAEKLYDQILRLDSSDLNILDNTADFYRINHRYEKAMDVLSRIVAHPNAESWESANARLHIGDMLMELGKQQAAITVYKIGQKSYLELLRLRPDMLYYKNGVAVSFEKLGSAYFANQNLDSALINYSEYARVSKELYDNNLQSVNYKYNVAISLEKLGSIYIRLGHIKPAMDCYEQYMGYSKDLNASFPNDSKYKNGLSVSYLKFGEALASMGEFKESFVLFQNSNQLLNTLCNDNPQNVGYKNGLAISYLKLGETKLSLGAPDTAITFFIKFNQLMSELYEAYPQNVNFLNRMDISFLKLAEVYLELNNAKMALPLLRKSRQFSEELCEKNSDIRDYKNNLAISCKLLGEVYTSLKSPDTALFFYKRFNYLEHGLVKADSIDLNYKNELAISYERLGSIYLGFDSLNIALTCFEKRAEIGQELCQAKPQDINFKEGLAIAYFKLGRTFYIRNAERDKDNAIYFLEKSRALFEELVKERPDFTRFQSALDTAESTITLINGK